MSKRWGFLGLAALLAFCWQREASFLAPRLACRGAALRCRAASEEGAPAPADAPLEDAPADAPLEEEEEEMEAVDALEDWTPDEPVRRPGIDVVALPIGNRGDITVRAMHHLRSADVFFVNSPKQFAIILKSMGIKIRDRPVISYVYGLREARKLVQYLKAGANVVFAGAGGTPLIEEQGDRTLSFVRKQLPDVPIRCVPGPCAATAALSLGTLPAQRFVFGGSLGSATDDRKRHKSEGQRRAKIEALLESAESVEATLVLYINPLRMRTTLHHIADVLEQEGTVQLRTVTLCKDLTRANEMIVQGTAHEVEVKYKKERRLQKGDMCLLIKSSAAARELNPYM